MKMVIEDIKVMVKSREDATIQNNASCIYIHIYIYIIYFCAAADRALGMVGQQSSYTVKEK